jgi:transcriptional regulator with XRE-family HTH domain
MRLRGLRQARQRQGISISQLAELSDVRRETITRVEHGQEDVSPPLVRRLAQALHISSQELITGTPAPSPHPFPSVSA